MHGGWTCGADDVTVEKMLMTEQAQHVTLHVPPSSQPPGAPAAGPAALSTAGPAGFGVGQTRWRGLARGARELGRGP